MNLKPVTPKETLLGYSQKVDGNNPERIVAAAKLCSSAPSPCPEGAMICGKPKIRQMENKHDQR